jgi:hypothetical protein
MQIRLQVAPVEVRAEMKLPLNLTLPLKWLLNWQLPLNWQLTFIPLCQADAVAAKTDQKRKCLSAASFCASRLGSCCGGNPRSGRRNWGRLLLLTFLGDARKVSGCRAAPGYYDRRKSSIGLPRNEKTKG